MRNENIGVIGLNHLGMVTSACLLELGYGVIAIDFDEQLIEKYNQDMLFLNEPKVKDYFKKHKNLIEFSSSKNLEDCDYVWITIDMPLDDCGLPDYEKFNASIDKLIPLIPDNCKVVVSSQVKLGTTEEILGKLKKAGKNIKICYSPENLRLGKSVDLFLKPDRIVIGCEESSRDEFLPLFESISNRLVWMEVKEAELSKHAINSFLAIYISFINQLSGICEDHQISCSKVTQALKTESRIGPNLPLQAGLPFAGGTLPRDLNYLNDLFGRENLFEDVLFYNDKHRRWILKKTGEYFGSFNLLMDKRILIVGLSYKEGINDSRFSEASRFIEELKHYTSNITLYDDKFDQESELGEYDCVAIFNKSDKISDYLKSLNKKTLILDPNNLCRDIYPPELVFAKIGEPRGF
jgi:UDPglucose 6-dehydrogenase